MYSVCQTDAQHMYRPFAAAVGSKLLVKEGKGAKRGDWVQRSHDDAASPGNPFKAHGLGVSADCLQTVLRVAEVGC